MKQDVCETALNFYALQLSKKGHFLALSALWLAKRSPSPIRRCRGESVSIIPFG